MHISPAPSPEEAAAIATAVQVLLQSAAGSAQADPRPPAYRSAWRRAAIRGGVGLPPAGGPSPVTTRSR